MSWWELPTTADLGLAIFSPSRDRLFEEAACGLQSILLAEGFDLHALVRSTSTWTVPSEDDERTLVRWLEEILYQAEVENRFLVDCQVRITDALEAQVSWVEADSVEREIEVKAVTRHRLECRALEADEAVQGEGEIPDFEGTGWFARVILDV